MEVEVKCADCGAILDESVDVTHGYRGSDVTLSVDACAACIAKAHGEGYEEGYEEGSGK